MASLRTRLYRVVVGRVGQVCLEELEEEDEDRLRSVGVEGLGQGMLLTMGTVSLAVSVVFRVGLWVFMREGWEGEE